MTERSVLGPFEGGRARWARLRGDHRKRRQIIVCGFPRAGTSLLYNMLSSSLLGYRFAPFERPARETLWRFTNWCSKRPTDVLELEEIVASNPRSKRILVLILIRDPRDLLISLHPNAPDRPLLEMDRRWSIRGRYPYRLRCVPGGLRDFHEAVQAADRLDGVGDVSIEPVRYEDLVSDPDAVQRHLAERHDLEFREAFRDFHRRPRQHAYRYEGPLARARAPHLVRSRSSVDRSRAGRWREPRHRERILSIVESHPDLLERLCALGYEHDDDWVAGF